MKKKRIKKIVFTLLCVLVFLFTSISFTQSLRKVFRVNSLATVKSFIYERVNLTTDRIVVESDKYGKLVTLKYGADSKVTSVETNTNAVNILSNRVAVECQEDLNKENKLTLSLPIGSLTGSVLLTNKGRKLDIPLTVYFTVKSDFKPLAENIGINVIRYALYLAVTTTAEITLPLNEYEAVFCTYILVSENIFTAEIPDTYIASEEGMQYLDLIP